MLSALKQFTGDNLIEGEKMRLLKNSKLSVKIQRVRLIVILSLILTIINAAVGCETYTKKSESCKNGVCTKITEKCEKGSCTITSCTRGKCTTTYSGTHPLAKENQKRGDTVSTAETGGKTESDVIYEPTVNHTIFIKFIDGYKKSRERMPDETSAMQQERMNKFDKSVFKKVSFKNLCLDDVKPDCIAGFGECNKYIVTFHVAVTDSGECNKVISRDYKAPVVVKRYVCKNEALRYKPGKRYNVSGKVSAYKVTNRKDNDSENFIRKYFYSAHDNSIELDGQEYYKCSKK